MIIYHAKLNQISGLVLSLVRLDDYALTFDQVQILALLEPELGPILI